MYNIISSLLGKLKVKPITIDNHIFQLHYRATMFLLVVLSLLVTQKQYFGDPIDCLPIKVIDILDTYCWIKSTYTVDGNGGGAYPGVNTKYDREGKHHDATHHTYYQWVALVLYLQALMFYIPRYLWKVWEGGRMKMLVEGLHLPILDEDKLQEKKGFLVSFLRKNFHKQELYLYEFMFCECLNFVNVILQIYFMDKFFGNEFSTYGFDVVREMQKPARLRRDVLELMFPKVTMCDFQRFGPSGGKDNVAALCVLPLNIINEKIYVVLWYWFKVVAAISGLGLLFRAATCVPFFRRMLLGARATLADPTDLDIVSKKSSHGDWFFIYQLAKNMDENAFRLFLKDLASDL